MPAAPYGTIGVMTARQLPRTFAVVAAGGRGSRMGGVDKPALEVAGRRLLDTALEAVASADRVVVVGPPRGELPESIMQVRESPAGAGPVAAVAAGLLATAPDDADIVVLLAADLPDVTAATIDALVARVVETDAPAAVAIDDDGRLQFLLAAWRADALRDALDSVDVTDAAMKQLLPHSFAAVRVPNCGDLDTREDLDRARAAARWDLGAARAAIARAVAPLEPTERATVDALGCVLATPLVAAAAHPPADRSAMDGYAVAGAPPWRPLADVVTAGGASTVVLEPGDAVRIATGAVLPDGAERVVRDEHLDVTDSLVTPLPGNADGDDTRRIGEDWHAGAHLAPAGTVVSPAVLSTALSAEVPSLAVRGPLRVRTILSGDEIRTSGPLARGETRDAVGPVVASFVRACGAEALEVTHLRDTAADVDALFSGPCDADVLAVVGGTGGGAADRLRDAITRAGGEIVVGRVRCRPGGSQLTAVLPDGRVVLGLPGNPFAAIATLVTILPAVVDAALAAEPSRRRGIVHVDDAADGARIVAVDALPDGTWHVRRGHGTATLVGLVGAAAFAVVPPLARGDVVCEIVPLP
ncbi:NTP transferase domain-containing protein [Rhodococcus rhodnii]